MWFFMGREAVNLSQQVSTNHLVGLGLIYTPLVQHCTAQRCKIIIYLLVWVWQDPLLEIQWGHIVDIGLFRSLHLINIFTGGS